MNARERAVVEAARVFATYEWCGEEGCPHLECHDIQRLVTALRDLDAECETCGGQGEVEYTVTEYVTHDMASDAESPEMEGQPIQVPVRRSCPACRGGR